MHIRCRLSCANAEAEILAANRYRASSQHLGAASCNPRPSSASAKSALRSSRPRVLHDRRASGYGTPRDLDSRNVPTVSSPSPASSITGLSAQNCPGRTISKQSMGVGSTCLNSDGATSCTARRISPPSLLTSPREDALSRAAMCSISLALAVIPIWQVVHRGRVYRASSFAFSSPTPAAVRAARDSPYREKSLPTESEKKPVDLAGSSSGTIQSSDRWM